MNRGLVQHSTAVALVVLVLLLSACENVALKDMGHGDEVLNYDLTSKNTAPKLIDADWPVNVIFTGYANTTRVDQMGPW